MVGQVPKNQISSGRVLAHLFAKKVFRELGESGVSPTGAAALRDSGFFPTKSQLLSSFYDDAFQALKRDSRSEYVFKNAIAEKILLGRHNLKTASMLTEFRAGSSKADVVVLNGSSTAYEIKSERDTLNRIDDQLSSYLGIFERVVVVTAECHLEEILDRIPSDVGITILNRRYQLSTVRLPESDLGRLNPGQMFESLQRPEYLGILSRILGWSPKGVPNGILHREAKSAFVEIPIEILNSQFVSALKSRGAADCPSEFLDAVPVSLKGLAVSTRLQLSHQRRVLQALGQPAHICLPIQ